LIVKGQPIEQCSIRLLRMGRRRFRGGPGRPVEPDRHLNSAVDLGIQERLAGARSATGVSAVPSGLGYSALNWWFFGYPDRAVARSAEAIGRAVECGDRFGQVMATVTGAILLLLLGDRAGFTEHCERGRRICVECDFGWWRALFEVLLSRLPITAAPNEEGIEQMRKGLPSGRAWPWAWTCSCSSSQTGAWPLLS